MKIKIHAHTVAHIYFIFIPSQFCLYWQVFTVECSMHHRFSSTQSVVVVVSFSIFFFFWFFKFTDALCMCVLYIFIYTLSCIIRRRMCSHTHTKEPLDICVYTVHSNFWLIATAGAVVVTRRRSALIWLYGRVQRRKWKKK
jgi:hypothetical protein